MSQPSPELFFDTVVAYQRTNVIQTALSLDVFTLVADGVNTANTLATRCQAAERGVRILCDALVTMGFLHKTGVTYGLTEDSALFLNRKSPAYCGSITDFLLNPSLVSGFHHLEAAVRQGGTALEQTAVEPNNPMWVQFARSMAPVMMMPAQIIADRASQLFDSKQPLKVLDIAAGHGLFGVRMAERFPLAEVCAVDWEAVLEVAKETALRAGVAARYRPLPGSAFEVDFGSGYDAVLLPNFLHHFDPNTCLTLIRRIYAALKPGGRVFTLEFIPNEDRVSPHRAAFFAVVMLAGTPSGDAYTFSDLNRMFRSSGFETNELIPLSPLPSSLLVSTK